MMKIVIKPIKMIIAFLVALFAGLILLAAVYALPVNPMKENVRRSVQLYTFEGTYPQWSTGYKFTQLDNCTDAYMLLMAMSPRDKSAFIDALTNPYIVAGNDQQWQDVTDYSQDLAKDTYFAYYSRYWGGYLTVLKPMLLFFEVSDIRVINAYLQFILIIAMVLLIGKKLGKKYIAPFMLLMLVLSPISLAMSFQFSTAFYTMMIAMFIMLLFDAKIGDVLRYCIFFEILGVVTNYVDFLTYPSITLGVPLTLYVIMHRDMFADKLSGIISLIKMSASWAVGYGAMWAGKWICYGIFTGDNLIANVLNQMSYHTTEEEWFGEKITRIGAVFKTLKVLIKWPYLLIGVAFVVWLVIMLKKSGNTLKNIKITGVLPFLFISLYPVIWFLVLFGHSYRCYWFTYRTWGTAAFALSCMIVGLLPEKE